MAVDLRLRGQEAAKVREALARGGLHGLEDLPRHTVAPEFRGERVRPAPPPVDDDRVPGDRVQAGPHRGRDPLPRGKLGVVGVSAQLRIVLGRHAAQNRNRPRLASHGAFECRAELSGESDARLDARHLDGGEQILLALAHLVGGVLATEPQPALMLLGERRGPSEPLRAASRDPSVEPGLQRGHPCGVGGQPEPLGDGRGIRGVGGYKRAHVRAQPAGRLLKRAQRRDDLFERAPGLVDRHGRDARFDPMALKQRPQLIEARPPRLAR